MSTQTPVCADCKYHVWRKETFFRLGGDMCTRKMGERNMISGEPSTEPQSCSWMRFGVSKSRIVIKMGKPDCGAEGRLFEPREKITQ